MIKSGTDRRRPRVRLRDVSVVDTQQFFRVVVGISPRLDAVEVRWRNPSGVAVVAFAGGPALVGELVVGPAGQRQPSRSESAICGGGYASRTNLAARAAGAAGYLPHVGPDLAAPGAPQQRSCDLCSCGRITPDASIQKDGVV